MNPRGSRRRARTLWRLAGAALAGTLVAPLSPAQASHAAPGPPVVVVRERLEPGAGGGGECAVAGAVHNPHGETVTASLVWRLTGPDGATLGFVTARLPRLAPGEMRSFLSSAHPLPCRAIPGFERDLATSVRVP